MIEAQLVDNDLYKHYSTFASYKSDLTKVVVLPDNYANELTSIGIKVNTIGGDLEGKIELSDSNGNFKFSGCDITYTLLLGATKAIDVYSLAREALIGGEVVASNSFKKKYHYSNNLKVKDLFCKNKRVLGSNRKYKTFKPFLELDVEKVVANPSVKTKEAIVRSMRILDVQTSKTSNGKLATILVSDCFETGQITTSFFSNVHEIANLLQSGEKINFLLERKEDGSYKVIKPVPKGYDTETIEVVSPSKEAKKYIKENSGESMAVDLFRAIYEEYLLRKEFGEKL